MPPPLHPKSIQTTSLFGTTLLLSFLVVGLPHVIPCPVDRRQFADGQMPEYDSDGNRIRRRRIRRPEESNAKYGTATAVDEMREATTKKKPRECPVPKPGGLVGHVLGFETGQTTGAQSKPSVRIRSSGGEDGEG